MKKTLLILLCMFSLLGLGLFLMFPQVFSALNKEVVYIAVVGPMSGPAKVNGDQMLQGINLYLDKLAETGELPGKQIALLIEDDQNDEQRAEQIALKLARENKALLVLGHAYSATSIAAGKLYRKYEIPAITASATADKVTLGNEWYFCVIPNNSMQAKFLAHYLKNTLRQDAVSIIALKNEYGASLAQMMKTTALDLGMQVPHEWTYDLDAPDKDAAIARIIAELTALPKPGAIFFATFATEEDAKIIMALRDSGKPYTIMGDDSFDETVPKLFEAAPKEQAQPGYYSDGVYAASPLLLDAGSKDAYEFEQQFVQKYGPDLALSWNHPCYYDAMHVAVEAIKQARLQGPGHIRSDRRNVRKALANLYSLETSVNGVSGPIYFDANNDVARPYAVGFFENRKFLPALTQYQIVDAEKMPENLIATGLTGNIIQIGDQLIGKVPLCWVGVAIHEVSRIDLAHNRYTLDFSLWFRFQSDLDATNIIFTNALRPVRLGPPIFDERANNVTTQAYRLRADFAGEADLHAYPFNAQTLAVKFRHADATNNEMVYVPSQLEPPAVIKNQFQGQLTPTIPPNWEFIDVIPYADMERNISTLGFPKFFGSTHTIIYPRFNIDIKLARRNLAFLVGSTAPFLILTVMLGIMYFVAPINWLIFRIAFAAALLAVNASWHLLFVPDVQVPYLVTLDYLVFAIYLATALAIFWSISGYLFYHRRLALVQGIYLFQPFAEKIKANVSQKMRRQRFRKPGQYIMRQGEQGDSLWGIIEGEVSIWVRLDNGQKLEVGRRKAGEFIGEMALLTGEPRSADVISVTPVLLAEITKKDFTPFLKKHPDIVNMMVTVLTGWKVEQASKKGQQIDQQALAGKLAEKINAFYGFTADN